LRYKRSLGLRDVGGHSVDLEPVTRGHDRYFRQRLKQKRTQQFGESGALNTQALT
jgi:hypothetical protein